MENKRPFSGLKCPMCGSLDCVSLRLGDLDTLYCETQHDSCTLTDQLEQVALWLRLKAWIDRVSE